MRVTIPVRIAGIVSVPGDSLDSRFAAVMGTTLGYLNMPDRRLMPGANDSAPFAHAAPLPEQVRLHVHAVVAVHAPGAVDAVEDDGVHALSLDMVL
jgi:hypothetical protein